MYFLWCVPKTTFTGRYPIEELGIFAGKSEAQHPDMTISADKKGSKRRAADLTIQKQIQAQQATNGAEAGKCKYLLLHACLTLLLPDLSLTFKMGFPYLKHCHSETRLASTSTS